MKEYPISPQEYLDCYRVGMGRCEFAIKSGVAELRREQKWSRFYMNLLGVIGEYAFRELSGLPMDRIPRVQNWDFKTKNGLTIDVKISTRSRPNLLVGFWKKKHRCDRYFLMSCPPLELTDEGEPVEDIQEELPVICVGWTTGEEVFREENVADLGYGATHLVKFEDLREWE